MPRLQTSTSVTATSEVELSPQLKKQLKAILTRYQTRVAEIKDLEALQVEAKDEIETAFVDAGEYGALLSGVRIDDIPIKRVEGGTTKTTDKKGIMKRFKITPAQWEGFVSEKPKKGHLSISLPRGKDDTEEDE